MSFADYSTKGKEMETYWNDIIDLHNAMEYAMRSRNMILLEEIIKALYYIIQERSKKE